MLFAGLVVVVIVIVLVLVLFTSKYEPSTQEIIALIENRMENGMSREWDYFRLSNLKDKRLDAVRERCLALDYTSPEERERELKRVLDELRANTPVSDR